MQNMKKLKGPLRKLHSAKYNRIHMQMEEAREKLTKFQQELQHTQMTKELCEEEKELRDKLYKVLRASYSMKCQSKQESITEGDKGSKLFYAWIKKRTALNYIVEIQNEEGVMVEGTDDIANIFVKYYTQILGTKNQTNGIDARIAKAGGTLTLEQQMKLIRPFSVQQVKEAVFSIPKYKSPEPDGYGSEFFQGRWKEVGELTTKAILDFFRQCGRAVGGCSFTATRQRSDLDLEP
ncbi:unnamed protein product [Cuscuta campestris]|uniref:Uncharacterized protein n=1 Tax=Cuscuta campestris TaxID=132261 RepID=A0A484M6C9_9ASTE|nr:unnamed protein product [Cuscuta campestris]